MIKSGILCAVSGASQTGKTSYVLKEIESSDRVVVWDVEDQYSGLKGFNRVTDPAELLRLLSSNNGAMKIAFVGSGRLAAMFEICCGAVFFAARYIAPLDFVAEELSDVCPAGKASDHFGILIRRGLKRGINIYAISQRWAEASKTVIGNSSRVVAFRSSLRDAEYLGKLVGIEAEKLTKLETLHFYDYDMQKMSGEFGKVEL